MAKDAGSIPATSTFRRRRCRSRHRRLAFSRGRRGQGRVPAARTGRRRASLRAP